ncbi:MAG: septal ring lytic transglycosylase RlpA family protein [Ferruginibacter sp.]
MNNFFVGPTHVARPVHLLLLFFTLFFCTASFSQKKHSFKPKVSKLSGKKVIYGTASFYANKFNGRHTASGEIFTQSKLTCACNVLPFGTWIRVTNLRNNKSVIVKVNDRLHAKSRRLIDLSKAASKKISATAPGLLKVKVEVLGKKKPV